jgi:signal transduction histidine kinase/CheY-like chemotaxis protein
MEQPLSFFNFSFRKVLALEPDSFCRAKLKIVFAILLFSSAKTALIIPFAFRAEQYLQAFRAGFITLLFLCLLKILLYRPGAIRIISYFIICCGVAVIWTNVFVYAQRLNIVTIQMVFMATLSSYYLIGGYRAALLTALSICPVISYLMTRDHGAWQLDINPEELVSPVFEFIVLLNFLTFAWIHYLYYQAFYENLREKELLNQQLTVNISEAKALAHSRTLFLSTMSHELRTPLNGVIGMASLIRDTALPSQKENLDILEFSAANLLSLVNDILDYNKSELDKIKLEHVPVNLFTLLHQICRGLEIKALEKTLLLAPEIDEKLLHLPVISDPTRLTQIIFNLAGNAIKFTEQGTVGICLKIIEETPEQIGVLFSVSDTGIGIATERQEAVFDPFVQASSDTTRLFGGTGLGLAIVKRLLCLFNSEIVLESQPGKGSVFSFRIDFDLCPVDMPETAAAKIVPGSLKGLKILIAEDNKINVMVLERLLTKWEIQSVVAVNGQEAVDQLSINSFDLVLMDLHMPVMDGYQATQAIRVLKDSARAATPILALTASVSHDIKTSIKAAGMQDYLLKPFQPDHLYQKLLQLCSGQPA